LGISVLDCHPYLSRATTFHFNLPAGPAMTLVAIGVFLLVAAFLRKVFS